MRATVFIGGAFILTACLLRISEAATCTAEPGTTGCIDCTANPTNAECVAEAAATSSTTSTTTTAATTTAATTAAPSSSGGATGPRRKFVTIRNLGYYNVRRVRVYRNGRGTTNNQRGRANANARNRRRKGNNVRVIVG
ncbi:hypothetical protein KR074_007796 [Drosophila pseudoananassae]|nr:hypothetical protein KR074_007796 [Drosophila pseudoananassae]